MLRQKMTWIGNFKMFDRRPTMTCSRAYLGDVACGPPTRPRRHRTATAWCRTRSRRRRSVGANRARGRRETCRLRRPTSGHPERQISWKYTCELFNCRNVITMRNLARFTDTIMRHFKLTYWCLCNCVAHNCTALVYLCILGNPFEASKNFEYE